MIGRTRENAAAAPEPDRPTTADATASTPFHDLDRYVAIPRTSGLALSRDGSRLVTTVQTLDPKRTAYRTALWEVDPAGHVPARRLTRSAKGESSATFTAAGDVLFTSARPDPDSTADDDPTSALWLLPAGGGEARVVATTSAGVSAPLAAADAPVVSVAADVLPSARDLAHDAALRSARKDAKVAAILHTGYPVRHWDHDLGPSQPHRFVADLTTLADEPARPLPAPGGTGTGHDDPDDDAPHDPRLLDLRDVSRGVGGTPGRALWEHSADLSADGTTLVTTWQVPGPGASTRSTLVAIDTATGERRTLVDEPGAQVHGPRVSPDGAYVAFVRETLTTPQQAPEETLAVVPLHAPDGRAGSADRDDAPTTRAENHATPRTLAPHWDRWPTSARWLPDGSGLLVTADDDGRGPVFLVSFSPDGKGEHGTAERVTSDDAVFTDVQVARRPHRVRAADEPTSSRRTPCASTWARSSTAVRRAPGPRSPRRRCRAPSRPRTCRARSSRSRRRRPTTCACAAGSRCRTARAPTTRRRCSCGSTVDRSVRGTRGAWRWNPWLMVARGYAVLLPDPALSTGYGQDFVQRGWGRWGQAPYTDLLAITDHVEALPEVDESRTAAMGGSFGGYMANWVAGHTDRFRAVVTHASLWALDQFGPTTDHSYYWQREMTPEMALENSPHRFVGDIVTPMLVIHGDKDYRVPIGEGLRLWYEPAVRVRAAGRPRRRHRPPVPVLPGREPLDPHAAAREGLVRGGPRVPRGARARRDAGRRGRSPADDARLTAAGHGRGRARPQGRSEPQSDPEVVLGVRAGVRRPAAEPGSSRRASAGRAAGPRHRAPPPRRSAASSHGARGGRRGRARAPTAGRHGRRGGRGRRAGCRAWSVSSSVVARPVDRFHRKETEKIAVRDVTSVVIFQEVCRAAATIASASSRGRESIGQWPVGTST